MTSSFGQQRPQTTAVSLCRGGFCQRRTTSSFGQHNDRMQTTAVSRDHGGLRQRSTNIIILTAQRPQRTSVSLSCSGLRQRRMTSSSGHHNDPGHQQ